MEEEHQQPLTRYERRAARTLKKLLDAARDIFLDRGLAAATIDEITTRADVGKGTFYIYYSSKSAVFETIVGSTLRKLLSRIRAAAKDADGLYSAVERIVEAELGFYREDPKGFPLVIYARTLMQLNEIELPECAEEFEKYFKLVEKVIRKHAGFRPTPLFLRRIAILLANVSNGYLSFAAFDIGAERMVMAFDPVRKAMIDAIATLVQQQSRGNASFGRRSSSASGAVSKVMEA